MAGQKTSKTKKRAGSPVIEAPKLYDIKNDAQLKSYKRQKRISEVAYAKKGQVETDAHRIAKEKGESFWFDMDRQNTRDTYLDEAIAIVDKEAEAQDKKKRQRNKDLIPWFTASEDMVEEAFQKRLMGYKPNNSAITIPAAKIMAFTGCRLAGDGQKHAYTLIRIGSPEWSRCYLHQVVILRNYINNRQDELLLEYIKHLEKDQAPIHCSHLCHQKKCIAPGHIELESASMNSDREDCANAPTIVYARRSDGRLFKMTPNDICEHTPFRCAPRVHIASRIEFGVKDKSMEQRYRAFLKL